MRLLLLLAVLPLLAAAPPAAPRAPAKEKPEPRKVKFEKTDLNDLHLEVMALQVLYNLRPTAAQLKSFAALAEKTAAEDPPRKAIKVSAKYQKALKGLRAALVADDDEGVDEALEALDKLREKEDPEFEVVEITDAAREHAPAVFRSLSARQVAFYVGGFGDDFPDPGELLHQALKEARTLKGKEWAALRDDVADQVGWLVAGLDAKGEAKVRGQVKDLLSDAHRLDDKEFKAAEAKLKKRAADLAAKVGPADVIRHFLERTLAELLSNPQLKSAVEARKKGTAKAPRAPRPDKKEDE